MLHAIKSFHADESGAVTVDWVVLTAALVGLGLAVMGVVRGGVANLSGDISNSLTSATPGSSTFGASELATGTLTVQ